MNPRATRTEWIGLAVIALPCVIYAMDLTVLFMAIPELTRDLEPSSTELLWITDIYGFALAGLLITMGTLGDRIGRRRLLMIGAALFGAVSVLAAFSSSPEMLIATRALLGIAGATLAPSTLSLIRNMFLDDHQRQIAIGVWATSFSAGAAIGPLAGGAMLEGFHWGSVFLLAVPVMVLLLVTGPRLLPEYKDPAPGRFDLVSAGLSLLAVLPVVYAVKHTAEHGSVDALAVGTLAGGLLAGAVFARRQLRLEDPLLDLSLFRRRRFDAALFVNTLGIFVISGSFLFISQYLQLVEGLKPLTAGLYTLPSALAFVAGSMVAPQLTRRMGTARVVSAGLVLAAIGLAMISQVGVTGGLALLVTGSIVCDFGLAWVVTLGTDLIVSAAPPERAGSASAVSETGAELGGALGIAILGSIGTAIYRSEVGDEIPAGTATGDTARDTLGGAVTVAGDLPAGVLGAAQEAFVSGMQVAAGISAALVVAAALLAGVLLRERRAAAEPPAEPSCAQA